MAHKTEYVTEDLKDKILKDNAKKLQRKLKITSMFMACLIRDGVISDEDAKDIQKLERESKQKNELVDHLRLCKLEDFVSFCVILHDEEKRNDIVCGDFGLDIIRLKRQKDEFAKANMESEEKGVDDALSDLPDLGHLPDLGDLPEPTTTKGACAMEAD